MARVAYPSWTGNSSAHEVAFSFAPQGTGQPTLVVAEGIKVVRTGVGTFTVTFDDVYYHLIDFSASVGAFLANHVRPGAFTSQPAAGGNSTLTIAIFADATSGAAGADITAGAANIVRISCVLATGKAVG